MISAVIPRVFSVSPKGDGLPNSSRGWVQHGGQPAVKGADAAAAMRISLAATRSLHEGRDCGGLKPCGAYNINCPPFTSRVSPTTKLAASEARNAIAVAHSIATPRRPSGIVATVFRSISGVEKTS